jgi:hypothetical protein
VICNSYRYRIVKEPSSSHRFQWKLPLARSRHQGLGIHKRNLKTVAEQEQAQPQALQLLAPSNVEMTGFEPVTSWLQTTRSPN